MSSHHELIHQAKQRQQENLAVSSGASQQLHKTVKALILSNSSNSSNATQSCSSVLDKITTIHQLDKQIDAQLQDGIATSFERLVKYRKSLNKTLSKSEQKLHHVTSVHASPATAQGGPQPSVVDDLQRRAEIVDQDLRILENTLKLLVEPRY